MANPTDQSAVAAPAATAVANATATAIPLKKVTPWAVLGSLVLCLAYYFIGAEQGATSVVNGMGVHEFVHDARHLLGFPCH